MEYKKNRQRVIAQSLEAQKTPEWSGLAAPVFLASALPAKKIEKARDVIRVQQNNLKQRIAAIIENPSATDEVYKKLQRVFKHQSPHNLNRENKLRFRIRKLARKRFALGYPPRKPADTSFGDAINWEWIVHCAIDGGKHIVIVTRDTDYGILHNKKMVLNDWLKQEFSERVSRTRKIKVTDRLAEAFKLISVRVSRKAEKQEQDLLSEIAATSVAVPLTGGQVEVSAGDVVAAALRGPGMLSGLGWSPTGPTGPTGPQS
jgi:hypothetical protein